MTDQKQLPVWWDAWKFVAPALLNVTGAASESFDDGFDQLISRGLDATALKSWQTSLEDKQRITFAMKQIENALENPPFNSDDHKRQIHQYISGDAVWATLRLLADMYLDGKQAEMEKSIAVEQNNRIVDESITREAPAATNIESSPVIARPANVILQEIKKGVSWHSRAWGGLNALVQEYDTNYRDGGEALHNAIERGGKLYDIRASCYRAAKEHGWDSAEVKSIFDKIQAADHELRSAASYAIKKGDLARKKEQANKGKPKSNVVGPDTKAPPVAAPPSRTTRPSPVPVNLDFLHPNDIRRLPPAAAWVLLVDETGPQFDEAAGEKGMIVGMLMPAEGHGLKLLPKGWHAVEQGSFDEIDRVVQNVLDARVGVIGISMHQLPIVPGERWAMGILTLIKWVLRLLPLSDKKTKLDVYVEGRPPFNPGENWQIAAEDAMQELTFSVPHRAKLIKLNIKTISKGDNPFNGYADAIAYTWGSPAPASVLRLKNTGWKGSCFLTMDPSSMLRTWQSLDAGVNVTADEWFVIIGSPDAANRAALTYTILERLGELCKKHDGLWQKFADRVSDYLGAGNADLKLLGRQVEWLEQWRPPEEKMLPQLRLSWLTNRLANANHRGETEQAWMTEMNELSARLMEENAELVCRAHLNLAVNATNRFDFDLAEACIQIWRNQPPTVPGLRYWAQIRSTMGQHAAFRGNLDSALNLFNEAISAFRRLSDQKMAIKDVQQTSAYLTTVMIDHPGQTQSAVVAHLEDLLDMTAINACRKYAADNSADYRYKHHLLLRWLVYRGADDCLAEYLSHQDHWQTNEGHPWPLIELYRGFLLLPGSRQAAAERAIMAGNIALAQDQGPTVRLIGACCMAIARLWGASWPQAENVLKELEESLPLAIDRIQKVRDFMAATEADPKQLLRAVLPFNFH